ncbi:MAG: hypothetical protein FWH00_02990 [Oscillospiraceae bacterium]|nr:hypothetical protein [Oscillospiraceae bacterium]
MQKRRTAIRICRISVLLFIIISWEALARIGVIDSFIMSQPTRILKTVLNMGSNNLLTHIGVTCFETIAGFIIGVVLGNLVALALWWSDFSAKVADPYLVVLNALPKIALGPCIIIWVGAGMQAVIVMALAISFVCIQRQSVS